MKKLVCILLSLLALTGLYSFAAAEETPPRGEASEGWHYYPGNPMLSTLLKDEDFWIVRVVCTEKEKTAEMITPRYTCKVMSVLRGNFGDEIEFSGVKFMTDEYCGDDGGVKPYTLQVGNEYILVFDRNDYTDGIVPFDPDSQSQYPNIAFWYNEGVYSSSNALRNEIKEAAEIGSVGELEEFFREAMPKDTSWQKPLIIGGWVVLGAGWAAWMLWALAKKRKRDAA